jgi:hypothetical protein
MSNELLRTPHLVRSTDQVHIVSIQKLELLYLKAEQEFLQCLTSFTMLTPNLDETLASFSFQIFTPLSGSDHNRSRRRPDQYQSKNDENDLFIQLIFASLRDSFNNVINLM